jgi:hypothetical protein
MLKDPLIRNLSNANLPKHQIAFLQFFAYLFPFKIQIFFLLERVLPFLHIPPLFRSYLHVLLDWIHLAYCDF